MVVKQVVDLWLSGCSVRETAKEFLLDLKVAGRTQSTRVAYETCLAFLAEYAEANAWPPAAQLDASHLRSYLAHFKDRPRWFGERDASQKPISDSYYEGTYRRLKRFFNWLVEQQATTENPMNRIPHPKIGQRVIQPVSDEEFFDLLDLTNPKLYHTQAHHFRAIRDQAVLWLLVATGGRKEEISSLAIQMVRLEEKRILVDGKGKKQRWLWLYEVTEQALGRYQTAREALKPATDAWWVDCQGKPMVENSVWVYNMLKRLGKRAGIEGLHPHRFRHTWATAMVEAEVSLPILEHMGGWSRIPKTYLATLGDRAAQLVQERVAPGERLAKKFRQRGSSQTRPTGSKARGKL